MVEITKTQFTYIKELYPDAPITVCSKRKNGSKGCRKSGKTYYCPESNEYMNALRDFKKKNGGV